eukprot:3837821-Prymnesium_polylepis.1
MVAAGKPVITQGDRGDYFYVCESGSFTVIVDGTEVDAYEASVQEKRHPCFGELSLLYGRPRAASIVATSTAKLWRLGRNGFRL